MNFIIYKTFYKGAGNTELKCPWRGPQLHVRGAACRVLLHPRGQHQGAHLAGPARQDAPDHQGESREAQGQDQALGWCQEHQYQGEKGFRISVFPSIFKCFLVILTVQYLIIDRTKNDSLPLGPRIGRMSKNSRRFSVSSAEFSGTTKNYRCCFY